MCYYRSITTFTLCSTFCVHALEDVMKQISRKALISIQMGRILWLKACIAEAACKQHLTCMPFQERLVVGQWTNSSRRSKVGRFYFLRGRFKNHSPQEQITCICRVQHRAQNSTASMLCSFNPPRTVSFAAHLEPPPVPGSCLTSIDTGWVQGIFTLTCSQH